MEQRCEVNKKRVKTRKVGEGIRDRPCEDGCGVEDEGGDGTRSRHDVSIGSEKALPLMLLVTSPTVLFHLVTSGDHFV